MQLGKQILIGMSVVLTLSGPAMGEDHGGAPDLSAWFGDWTTDEHQQISIAPGAEGMLAVSANASFGADDPERAAMGAVNVGGFSGEVPVASVRGTTLIVASAGEEIMPLEEAGRYDCMVEMELAGETLEVIDNGGCGGLNVSFVGTYRR